MSPGNTRTAPGSTYDSQCITCPKTFTTPGAARRHAREQWHRVRIIETVDGRNGTLATNT